MPPQVGKSGLVGKLGNVLNQAVAKHAGDNTEYGRMQIPPGISNGVAQLSECKFGIYKTGDKAGEYFWRAVGIILEPKSVNFGGQEIPTAGEQTSIMHPVCNTKDSKGNVVTVESHVADILNEMRKLGATTEGMTSGSQLEELCVALTQAKPFFRFRTSVRKAQKEGDTDGVWENWHGSRGLEEYVPPEDVEASQDASGEPEAAPEVAPPPPVKVATSAPAAKPPAAPAAGPKPKPGAKKPEPEPEPIADLTEAEIAALSIPELLTLCNELDGEEPTTNATNAQAHLSELASQAGVEASTVENAGSWAEIVQIIENANAAAEAPAASEAPEWKPKVGDVYGYKSIDPKTKKPKAKATEVQVKVVDEAKKTVDLLSVEDKKTIFKSVAWDKLEEA